MRVLKFRAWDGERLFPYMSVGEYGVGYFEYVDSPENLRVMQYTGITDANFKEIYEGDILKVPDLYELPENTSMTYHNQVIEFKNFSFQMGDSPLGEDYEYVSEECEVIGNIHENPELLELARSDHRSAEQS